MIFLTEKRTFQYMCLEITAYKPIQVLNQIAGLIEKKS